MLKKIYNKVTHEWDTSVEEALKSFIRLPALSPDFDKKWEENGVLLKALEDAPGQKNKASKAFDVKLLKTTDLHRACL